MSENSQVNKFNMAQFTSFLFWKEHVLPHICRSNLSSSSLRTHHLIS